MARIFPKNKERLVASIVTKDVATTPTTKSIHPLEKSRFIEAKENLALAKMMRDRHAINKWMHRLKMISKTEAHISTEVRG